ncbi:MAG: PAS domain-containing protein, partial [Bacteroidota bacterium]
DKGAEIIGFPIEEVLGENIWKKFPFLVDSDFYRACHQAVEGNSFSQLDVYYPQMDRWVACRFHPHSEGLSIYFHDITQQKKTYQALEENQLNYELIVESVPGAVIQYQIFPTGKDKLLFMSNKAEALWEVTKEEAYQDANSLWSTVLEEDILELQQTGAHSAQTLEIWNYQWRIKTASGKMKWLKGKGLPQRQEDGSTIWDIIIIDISDLITTSQALKEHQNKLAQLAREHKRILDSISQGLVVFRDELIFDFCNESSERMLQVRDEDIRGRHLLDVFPSVQNTIFETSFKAAFEEKKSQSFEAYLEEIGDWYLVNVYPNPDEAKISVYFQRITAQKKAKDELLKYKAMLDRTELLTNTGSWEWELETGKVIWSKELFNIFQMDPNQEPPDFQNHGQILSREELEKIQTAASETVARKTPYRIEVDIIRHNDQKIRHCLSIGYPRLDTQGNVTHIFGAIQDITDQKDAEKEILKYKDMLDRTELLTNTGSWEWDVETDQVIWSKELFHIFQIDPHQGAPDFKAQKEIYRPEELLKLQEAVNNALLQKQPYRLELTIIRKKDRELRHCLTIGYPRIDEQGNVKQLFGAFQDITEQKKAEEKLRVESRRLNDVLKGTNVGTWEWNVQTGKMVFNERWATILGYTLEELSPVSIDTWERFIHPRDLGKSNNLLEKHFSGELDYYEFEAQMRHKAGHWIWILDRGKVIEWEKDGKPLFMSGTRQEITERKNAELELILKQNELEQLLLQATDQNKR